MSPRPDGCRCGSGAHPRQCEVHPEYYRLHVAELNVECHLPDDPAAEKAMTELLEAQREALQGAEARGEARVRDELQALQKLVFKSVPLKLGGLAPLWSKEHKGPGGVTEHEAWLRTLDYPQLDKMIRLHTGAIDALRYRRNFIQHEVHRRNLHSNYGKHPLEFLFNLDEVSR